MREKKLPTRRVHQHYFVLHNVQIKNVLEKNARKIPAGTPFEK